MPIKDKKTKSVTTPLLDKVNNPNDLKFIKYYEFDIPIISVGNLSVGGTGKTPLVNYIISILKNDYKGFRWQGI